VIDPSRALTGTCMSILSCLCRSNAGPFPWPAAWVGSEWLGGGLLISEFPHAVA